MVTEKKLIDANALVDAIEDIDWYHINEKGKLVDGANSANNTPIYKAFDIYNAIKNAPTVDAVEVKCKVGDLVYALWEAPVKLKYIIYCAEVKEIRVSMRNCRLTTTYILEPIDYRGHRKEYRDEDFGTLVFKKQEDAEDKLYPCEHCMSGTYRSCEGCSYGERKDNETV